MKPGTRNAITDIRGLKVGNAQDQHLKSGATVLTADKPFVASVHVMGGAPGSRETDLLAPDKTVTAVDALVLSGGSAFGLDACAGVMDGLHAMGRGFAVGPARIPLVPGAILFDLLNGGDKSWTANPYRELGAAALRDASTEFEIGSVGAGTGAMAAMQKGGLGTASFVLNDGTTVGALVGANPIGSVTTPGDQHFWASPFEVDGEFGNVGTDTNTGLFMLPDSRKSHAMHILSTDRSNTTIAIVATDAELTKALCHRMAVAAHDGIARAIVPAHTPYDGDLVFGVATGEGAAVDDAALLQIGHAAAVCLSRAIARAIYHATPHPNDTLPCYRDM